MRPTGRSGEWTTQLEDASPAKLDRAAFRAARGRLVGPVKARQRLLRAQGLGNPPPRPRCPRSGAVESFASGCVERGHLTILVPPWEATATATWKARTACAPAYDWYIRCSNWDRTNVSSIEDEFLWLN